MAKSEWTKRPELEQLLPFEADIYTLKDLHVIRNIESDGMWHLSISCQNRLPEYHELKKARYDLLPADVYMAQIFPPQSEFVNIHEYCLHLFQIEKPKTDLII